MLPHIPSPLEHTGAEMLEFPRLRELVAAYATTAVGRDWVLALEPSSDVAWITNEQSRVEEVCRFLAVGSSFDFHGLTDPSSLLERARIPGTTLDIPELHILAKLVGRFHAFSSWQKLLPQDRYAQSTFFQTLAAPLLNTPFSGLLHTLEEKFAPDGTLADNASPELARIRRSIERQHRAIEESLHHMQRRLRPEGALQEDLITTRGDRFVLPVKAEWKRRIPGVVHGASSSGQTLFVEPLETIEQNNELQRLLEEEEIEIQRILSSLTRLVGGNANAIQNCALILTEIESLFARARFATEYQCTSPAFLQGDSKRIFLQSARHPLLQHRLRVEQSVQQPSEPAKAIVPLDLELPPGMPQLIISGPNTGGKTVALKTVGLLALMAQSGIPIPAETAELPVFDAVLADIGDAQSIAENLSTFSAHILRLNTICNLASEHSLVLLDELGSATDPEEGAALAAALAGYLAKHQVWCLISTHHTSMKIYAANTPGVQNAAAGFDEETFAPTYHIRMGVPGISAGIQIAQRLGLNSSIIADAQERLGKHSLEIGRFLDQLHADLLAVAEERTSMQQKEEELEKQRLLLENEGKTQQQKKVQEMELKLSSLFRRFESQIREAVRSIEDKAAQQKTSRQAERELAKLRREFRQQVDSTLLAHKSGADQGDPHAQPHLIQAIKAGDTVKLRSFGKIARIERSLDENTFEVSIGSLKMRVRREEIAEIVSSASTPPAGISPAASAKKKGIRVSLTRDPDTVASEINVIGRTVEEATDAVEKYLDHAFLEGLPRIRIVHGSGMGILRRALRSYLSNHPHVAHFSEPPQNQGGAGATLVELRQ